MLGNARRRRRERLGWSAALRATWSRSPTPVADPVTGRSITAFDMRLVSAPSRSRCSRIPHVASSVALATICLTVAVPTPAGAGSDDGVVRVPETIDATGREDVGPEMAKFFATVPDGTSVVFPAGARYRVEQSLVLGGRRNLTILGNGATVFATTLEPADRSQWVIRGSSRIVFRNLSVVGAHENGGMSESAYVEELETQHGFRLEGANDIELDRVTVTNVFGDFVYVGRNDDRVPSQRVWIHDSTFADNGRQGIAITDAKGVVIERNQIDRTRRSVIDLEPNTSSSSVSGVFVFDNIVGPGRLLFVASHGGGPVSDVVVADNELRGHALTVDVLAPEGQRRANWIVSRNSSDTPLHLRGLRFIGVDGVVVRGNRQEVTGGEPALIFSDTCGAIAEANDFGSGIVEYKGGACEAQLRMPVPPRIVGRSPRAAPATTTSSLRPPTTPTPGSTTTSSTRAAIRPGTLVAAPTTVMRGGDSTEGGGDGDALWLFSAAVALVAAVAILWRRRARAESRRKS